MDTMLPTILGVNGSVVAAVVVVCVLCLAVWLRGRAKHAALCAPRQVELKVFPATHADAKLQPVETVVVTGGGGFVGRHLVRQLLCGVPSTSPHAAMLNAATPVIDRVRVVVLDVAVPPGEDRDPRVTYIQGDVTNAEHVAAALDGAHTVFHVAAVLPSLTVPDVVLRRVNIGGTLTVVKHCEAPKSTVRRLILTSSASAILRKSVMTSEAMTEAGTTYPTDTEEVVDTYAFTKITAETVVLSAHEASNGKLQCVVLRPCAVYGIGDRNLADSLVSGQSSDFYLGKGTARLDFVDVESVAYAHVRAWHQLRKPPPHACAGKCFFVGSGCPTVYREFIGYRDGSKALSWWRRNQPRGIPLSVLAVLVFINETMYRLTGWVPLHHHLSATSVTFTQRTWTVDITAARTELGFTPVFDNPSQYIPILVDKYYADLESKNKAS